MPEAVILAFSGVTEAEYASVNGHLGIDMQTGEGDRPRGLLSHAAGWRAGAGRAAAARTCHHWCAR